MSALTQEKQSLVHSLNVLQQDLQHRLLALSRAEQKTESLTSQTTQDTLRIGELKEEVRTLRSEREKLFGRVEGLAAENERLRSELFVFRRVLGQIERKNSGETQPNWTGFPEDIPGWKQYQPVGPREDLAEINRMRNREAVSLVDRIPADSTSFRRNYEVSTNIGDDVRKNSPKFEVTGAGSFVATDANLISSQIRYTSPPRTNSANFQVSNILTWGNTYNSSIRMIQANLAVMIYQKRAWLITEI